MCEEKNEKESVSVVIPMYNEEEILLSTITRLVNELSAAFGENYELIFADDGSRDASRDIVAGAAADNARIKLLAGDVNRGKGNAVRRGILAATGDLILFTDCDLAYGTAVLPEMTEVFRCHPEYDLVIGSRALHPEGYEGYTLGRKILSRGYLAVLMLIGGIKVSDSQTGLKGFRRNAAKEIFSRCEIDRFAFDFEILTVATKLGYTIGEMPVKIISNRPSSVSFVRDSLRMLRDVIKLRFRKIQK